LLKRRKKGEPLSKNAVWKRIEEKGKDGNVNDGGGVWEMGVKLNGINKLSPQANHGAFPLITPLS
jgi:hypothetical protein